MAIDYIVQSTNDFFTKLDKIHRDLEKFSQNITERRDIVFNKLAQFNKTAEIISHQYDSNGSNSKVDLILQQTLQEISASINEWHHQIENNKKGVEFMRMHEKYLVVMVFGSVKAGKSSLGNFFAGKYFRKADFDNIYKCREHPVFAMQEKGREVGDIERDKDGDMWFSEGVTDTTGAIQYYTLSGLRWVDSPGTGALSKHDDTRNMEEMVNEYIPYTDLCIFLMNSSEPGLQADMKYIEKLSKDNQEAIVVITKSDINEEDEDETGNLISCWKAKSEETRKLQEDDICKRITENYPNISGEKFRAISVSTLLAKLAIVKHDEILYRESNLDLLMNILGDKVSDNAIKIKEEKPKKNLNNFINSIIEGENSFLGILGLDRSLESILIPIRNYQKTIKDNTKKISDNICSQVRQNVQRKLRQWAAEVDETGKGIDADRISQEISNIVTSLLQLELNNSLARIIDDYREQKTDNFKMSFETPNLEKQYTTIRHDYTEIRYEERDPRGMWEKFRGFFGKHYYKRCTDRKSIVKQVDIGTNVDELLEVLMPQVKKSVTASVQSELEHLQQSYFQPQEKYVEEMRQLLKELRVELLKLRF